MALILQAPPEFSFHTDRLHPSTIAVLAEEAQNLNREIEINVPTFANFLYERKGLFQSDPEGSYLTIKALVVSGNLSAAMDWQDHQDHPGVKGYRALAFLLAGNSEEANLLFSSAREYVETASDSFLALEVLGLYMFYQTATRQREEALDTFYQAMEIYRNNPGSKADAVIGWALTRAAYTLRAKGELDAAHKLNNQALSHADLSGNRLLQALALLGIGMCLESSRNSNQALDFYERALDLCEEIGADAFSPMILNRMGMVLGSQGRVQEAEQTFEAAVTIARQSGSFWLEFGPLGNLASIHGARGDFEGALKAYIYARDCASSFGDLQDTMWFSITIGNLLQQLGRPHEAQQSFRQAKKLAEKLGFALIFQERGNNSNAIQ